MNAPPDPDVSLLYNIKAEQALLGALFLDPSVIADVRAVLNSTDFHHPTHSLLYEVVCTLHDRHVPVDLATVGAALENLHHPDIHGNTTTAYRLMHGNVYLPNLIESCPCSANALHYAEIVRNKSVCRQAKQLGEEISALASTGDIERLTERNGHFNVSALISSAQPAPALELLDAGQFLANVGTPPPMLVQSLLPERSLILLSGKPKHGKSFLALDIADAVSQGRDVLGEYPVNRPGRVIYLSMEDSKYTLANRLLLRGIKPGDKRPLTVCSQRFTLGTSEGCETLRRLIKPLSPVLLIVDTAAQSLGVRDWSNRSEIVDRMGALMELAREVCTVLLVAHNRKAQGEYGDEIAGSNGFTAAVDGWLSAQTKQEMPGGNMRVTYALDGRDIRGGFVCEMDTKTLHFCALTKEQIEETNKLTEAEAQTQKQHRQFETVACAIGALGGLATAAQLQEQLHMTQPTFSRLAKTMMNDGHLRESGQFQEQEGQRGKKAALLTVCQDSVFYSLIQNSIEESENE